MSSDCGVDFVSTMQNVIINHCVKEPASAKRTFSSSKEPSAFRTISVLEFLKETWGNMAKLPRFSEVKDAIQKGLESLEKYHGKVDDSDAYFLCLCKSATRMICDDIFNLSSP